MLTIKKSYSKETRHQMATDTKHLLDGDGDEDEGDYGDYGIYGDYCDNMWNNFYQTNEWDRQIEGMKKCICQTIYN